MKEEFLHILEQAVEEYGTRSQKIMAVEEMAELLNAFAKFERGRCSIYDIITEIADVTIMMEQLRIIYGPDAVDAEIQRKVERLQKRLNNG